MSNWQSESSDFMFETSWNKSTDRYSNFDSALSSIVSSPAASNSSISQDNFLIHELIGKLTTTGSSGEIFPHSHHLLAAYNGNSSNNSSPSKSVYYPIMDHFGKEKLPNLGSSVPMNPNLVSADPGFAERAAKFSCFGTRSLNGRVSQLTYGSSSSIGRGKLSRISSSPLLIADGSPVGILENKNLAQPHMEMRSRNGSDTRFNKVPEYSASDPTEFPSSNEGSSVSEQIPSGDIGLKTQSDYNSRKRKALSKEKSTKTDFKVAETEDDSKSRRSKSSESKPSVKTEEEAKTGDESNPKPPEPPKDYIHVRARRGQATDSHSLAERVRREKISERMKLLQDLVPNCNKVTGKALMLDEIINYVQSLQRQVEFLSMKLASVGFSMDSVLVKNEFQPIGSMTHPIFPLNFSASAVFGHHTKETPKVNANFSNGTVTQCSIDPMNTTIFRNNSMQLTQMDEFGQALPQFATLCEDDLQRIVQMGFGQKIEL